MEAVQQLQHNWVCYYDNVSSLPDWFSDILCRAATGEGFSKRQLYSDDEDVTYAYRRCIGINGVDVQSGKRPDFLDRSIIINLDRVSDKQRRPESELSTRFTHQVPGILGGCFDALARAIKLFPTMTLHSLPRMADFAKWGAGIAEGLGYTQSDFLSVYREYIVALNELAIERRPFAQAIVALLDSQVGAWQGSATELLNAATAQAGQKGIRTNTRLWPGAPIWAKRRLEQIRVNLQQIGIEVTCPKRRLIVLRKMQPNP